MRAEAKEAMHWLERVNLPQDGAEEALVKESIVRGRPFGSEAWVKRTARQLALEYTLRPRGRQVGWRKTHGNGWR
jgi:putative transposase